jgi:hypothetical protein
MPERLTDPRYWKQTTQDIAGAFAAPPKPQGTPGAFIENTSRPTDKFATQIGEQISPTLGAFGMGQLAGDTALRFSEGDYTGAVMNAPMLAMAFAPGVKKGGKAAAREIDAYHGTGTGGFSEFQLSRAGNVTDPGILGRGVYAYSEPGIAGWYAEMAPGSPSVMPLKMNLEKPFTVEGKPSKDFHDKLGELIEQYRAKHPEDGDLKDFQLDNAVNDFRHGDDAARGIAESVTDLLQGQGYDGVIYKYPDGGSEYVAFDPRKVRSRYAPK